MKKFIIISCLIFTGISFAFFSCERNDMYSLSLWYKYPPRIIATDGTGATSYIHISDDNGETWKQVGPQGTWNAVASSSDGMKIVAATADIARYIYTSTDGGKSWTQRFGSGSNFWYSLASSSDGTKLVAADSSYNGGSGKIFFSIDSGLTWITTTPLSYMWGIATISSDGTRAAVNESTGGPNTTLGIFNGSWSVSTSLTSNDYYSLASSSDGMKLAIGAINGNSIYTSSDAGTTWNISGSGAGYWSSIASSSDGMKLAAINCNFLATPPSNIGFIYTSTDGGATWTQRTSAGNLSWRYIASSQDGTRLAATIFGGSIYTSKDGGATWIERTGAGSRTWSSIVITK